MGVVRHFHGDERESGTNADPAVTDFENRYNGSINAWRGLAESAPVLPEAPAQLVAHFTVRGNALRGNFEAGMGAVLDELGQRVMTGDNLEQMVRAKVRSQADALREQIRAALPDTLPAHGRAALVESVLASLPQIVEAQSLELRATVGHCLGPLAALLPAAVRASHRRTLALSPAPPLRVEALRRRRWRAEVFGPGALVLGDAGPVARVAGRAAFRTFTDKDEASEEVFLPLAGARLLVGRREEAARPLTEIEEVNRASARCRAGHCVPAQRAAREEGYQPLIGE